MNKRWPLVVMGFLVLVAIGLIIRKPAVPQRAARLFVSSEESGMVSVIDLSTNAVLSQVAVGKRPRGVQVSADGDKAYVALSGSPNMGPGPKKGPARKDDDDDNGPADKSADGVGVIDANTGKLLMKLHAGSDPEQLAITRDGKTLYVSDEDASELAIVDIDKNEVTAHIPVGKEPEGVTLTPDASVVWVTSEASARVDAIDTKTHEILGSVDVGARPRAIALTKDGARALVTLEDAGSVGLIDTQKRTLLKTVKLPGENIRPMGVVISPDKQEAYVTTGRGKKVIALDPETLHELWSLEVGTGRGGSPFPLMVRSFTQRTARPTMSRSSTSSNAWWWPR